MDFHIHTPPLFSHSRFQAFDAPLEEQHIPYRLRLKFRLRRCTISDNSLPVPERYLGLRSSHHISCPDCHHPHSEHFTASQRPTAQLQDHNITSSERCSLHQQRYVPTHRNQGGQLEHEVECSCEQHGPYERDSVPRAARQYAERPVPEHSASPTSHTQLEPRDNIQPRRQVRPDPGHHVPLSTHAEPNYVPQAMRGHFAEPPDADRHVPPPARFEPEPHGNTPPRRPYAAHANPSREYVTEPREQYRLQEQRHFPAHPDYMARPPHFMNHQDQRDGLHNRSHIEQSYQHRDRHEGYYRAPPAQYMERPYQYREPPEEYYRAPPPHDMAHQNAYAAPHWQPVPPQELQMPSDQPVHKPKKKERKKKKIRGRMGLVIYP